MRHEFPPIVANVRRVLAHYGLEQSVAFDAARCEPDRVYAWPNGHDLLVHVVLNRWPTDAEIVAERHHGEGAVSFREPDGVSPALQVILHPNPHRETTSLPYFLELDLDLYGPNSAVGMVKHGGEVLVNKVTRRKTDQSKVAARLDERFKPPTEAA